MRPRVSVVMSSYNGGSAVIATLESLTTQTGIDFEIVVVDDGSTDGSGAVLEAAALADRRIRVVPQENEGLTCALARGCAEAQGEFIARQDVDDQSLPGRLAKQAGALEREPRLSMVSSWAMAVGPGDEVLWETRRPEDSAEATDRLLHRNEGPPHHGSVMFRREGYLAVGGYRREFWFAQDVDLWLRLGGIGGIRYLPEVLYAYRFSEEGISSRYRDVQVELGALARECHTARLSGRSEDQLLARAAALRPSRLPVRYRGGRPAAGAYLIGRCLARKGDRRGIAYLRRALRLEPWNPRHVVGFAHGLLLVGARARLRTNA